MSTEERKEREKEKRRNRILDAAERIIFSKGIERATMDEIADKAELSKGTLYLYFKNKTDLYFSIAERGSDILNNRMAKVLTVDAKGVQLLKLMGEEYIDFVKNNIGYYHAFTYYESQHQADSELNEDQAERYQKCIEEGFSYIVRALQIGMQDGSIDDSFDPKELAFQIWGSVRGLIQLSQMKDQTHRMRFLGISEENNEKMVLNHINLLLKGMSPEPKLVTDFES